MQALFVTIKHILLQTFKLLTFQKTQMDIRGRRTEFIMFAVYFAWIAGLGRYWDHPSAHWWQYAGLGSVAYIFFLAFILWAMILPLRPQKWSYSSVLIFIGLTSPLAWIYAIPVERFMTPASATQANIYFLLIVAAWRVALYGVFLWGIAGLRQTRFVAAFLLPLVLIVNALAMLNLEQAVFNIMAGIDSSQTQRDQIYGRIVMTSMGALLAAPFIFILYLIGILNAWRERKADAQ